MDAAAFSALVFNPACWAVQPLQSRAEQNTRKSESGRQPDKPRHFQQAGAAQTHQIIWHQEGPGCFAATGQRSGSQRCTGLLPRGEIQ